MSMKELDKKIEKFKKWQDKVHAELERRTKVEQEAEELICQGKMQEAMELLNTLDDEKFRRMIESEDGEIEEEPEEEVVDTEQTDEEVDDEKEQNYKDVIEKEYNELCFEVIREGKRRVKSKKADEETMELLATSAKMVSQILYFGH